MGAKAGGFTVVAVEDEKSECNKMKIREIADYYINTYYDILDGTYEVLKK